ncbi:polysaccharide biosynthesis protein [Actinopolymorpha pittospori]
MRERMVAALRRRRAVVLALVDSLAWLASMVTFAMLSEGSTDWRFPVGDPLMLGLLAAFVHTAFGRVVRLHHGRTQLGSFAEARVLAAVTLATGLTVSIATLLQPWVLPFLPTQAVAATTAPAATFMTLATAAAARACWREGHQRHQHEKWVARPSASTARTPPLEPGKATLGIAGKVAPGLGIPTPRAAVSDVRDVELTDLLGRRQVDTDLAAVADYLAGRRVLVTGAGGSIGSELCRQIHRFAPAELIMLDRDDSGLHAVQLSIHGRALLDSPEVVLADIRDGRHIRDLFAQRRPDVVFHAAALKHLPMLEQYPNEAVKTNVWGSLSVLDAARACGVERFVNISTDKAARPRSVLGYSKRLAEGLTSAIATESQGTYLSVRFGNVLGSRGSMLTAFMAQIAAGGPVTVTHPDVTRYFMTVQEAVELVIQAAAIGGDGEALILDMGRPVRIADVARHLIATSGRKVEVVYTGLRDGEKLHEDLFDDGEPDHRPRHPLVSHLDVRPVAPALVHEIDLSDGRHGVIEAMRSLCLGMTDVAIPEPRNVAAESSVEAVTYPRGVQVGADAAPHLGGRPA